MNGQALWISADPYTRCRLIWAKHAAAQLGGHASNSTIVRRAVADYVVKLERLIDATDSGPVMLELARLRNANRGDTFSVETPTLLAVPIRRLSEIRKEFTKQQPQLIDWVKQRISDSRPENIDE